MLKQRIQQITQGMQANRSQELHKMIDVVARQIVLDGQTKPYHLICISTLAFALGSATMSIAPDSINLLKKQLRAEGYKCEEVEIQENVNHYEKKYTVESVSYLKITKLRLMSSIESARPSQPVLFRPPALTIFRPGNRQAPLVQRGYPIHSQQVPLVATPCSVASDGFKPPLPDASHIPETCVLFKR